MNNQMDKNIKHNMNNNMDNYRHLIHMLIKNSYTEKFEWLSTEVIQNKLKKVAELFKDIEEIYIQFINLKYYADLHKKEYYKCITNTLGRILTREEKEKIKSIELELENDKKILSRKVQEIGDKKTLIKYEIYDIGYLLYQFNTDVCSKYFDEEIIQKYKESMGGK